MKIKIVLYELIYFPKVNEIFIIA